MNRVLEELNVTDRRGFGIHRPSSGAPMDECHFDDMAVLETVYLSQSDLVKFWSTRVQGFSMAQGENQKQDILQASRVQYPHRPRHFDGIGICPLLTYVDHI